jgi:hypothetical protein
VCVQSVRVEKSTVCEEGVNVEQAKCVSARFREGVNVVKAKCVYKVSGWKKSTVCEEGVNVEQA